MTVSHAGDVLELPSQKQLLTQLKKAVTTNSNLINIQGEEGAGKSFLALQYQAIMAEEQSISLIECNPSQTLAEQRSLLLSQLIDPEDMQDGELPFDENDPINETIAPVLTELSYDLAFVLDDAHYAAPELLQELYALVLAGQENPDWNINILAFSLPDELDVINLPVSLTLDIQDLHVAPLSDSEIDFFVSHLVAARVRDEKQRKRILKRAFQVPPYPSDLLGLSLQQAKWYDNVNWKLAGGVGGGVLALVLLLSWWQSGPDTEELKQMPEWRLTVDEKEALSKEDAALQGQLAGVDEGAEIMPPPVTEQTVTVGEDEDERQRVVVPSDMVDDMENGISPEEAAQKEREQLAAERAKLEAERAKLEAEKKARAQAAAKAKAEQEAQAKARAQAAAKAKADAEAKAKAAQSATSTAGVKSSTSTSGVTTVVADDGELMKLPASRYTLQLGALSNLSSALKFVDKHQIKNQARIYKTVRNGKPLYVVTYQDYASADQARAMAGALPQNLRALNPWPKSIAQVQAEIKQN